MKTILIILLVIAFFKILGRIAEARYEARTFMIDCDKCKAIVRVDNRYLLRPVTVVCHACGYEIKKGRWA